MNELRKKGDEGENLLLIAYLSKVITMATPVSENLIVFRTGAGAATSYALTERENESLSTDLSQLLVATVIV